MAFGSVVASQLARWEQAGTRGGGGGKDSEELSREFTLPWREAGPPNRQDDKVDSDQ